MKKISIGIVAPSSKAPRIELKMGISRLKKEGFIIDLHPQCAKGHLFFAGTDTERAEAFFEYASQSRHQVIWCARGGHGAIRILPLLEKMASDKGIPGKKLLVGYSDSTSLMEYVRRSWGWSTLHAPMPGLKKFSILEPDDWNSLSCWIRKESTPAPWAKKPLTFWTTPPEFPIQAPLVGGNLTVWASLLGTRFQGKADDSILFLEDVDESLYRIDRTLQQLLLAKAFDKVRAIVLGNFMNCRDHSPMVLKSVPPAKTMVRVLTSPKPSELKPLRKVMKESVALREIFQELGEKLRIPVAFGLPVGHGPELSSLPLGAEYRLLPQGQLELVNWDWMQPDRVPDSPLREALAMSPRSS